MNGFLIYAAKRFVQFVFVVFLGITLAFLITHLSPVDPGRADAVAADELRQPPIRARSK